MWQLEHVVHEIFGEQLTVSTVTRLNASMSRERAASGVMNVAKPAVSQLHGPSTVLKKHVVP